MKRLIIWLAKKFNVNLVTEKIVIKEVEKQIALEGVIEEDVTVKGNLIINGELSGDGEITCYK